MDNISLDTRQIDVGLIDTSPTQPRKHFDAEKQASLTASMIEHGFTMSLLLVRPKAKGFELVLGERRLRSAKEAKITKVPCIVRQLSDHEVLEMQLIENIEREDLTPIEEAEHLRMLLDIKNGDGKPAYTYESLGQRINRSPRVIRDKIALCNLDEEARREVESGRLPPSTAILIGRIQSPDDRLKATKLIIHPQYESGPLSYRKAEELIHRQFIRDLRNASFDQDDADLLPVELDGAGERTAGGACRDCPFKSGVAKAGEVAREKHNVCLKPSCYERKEQRIWDRWQQSNTSLDKKRRAVTREESAKLYQFGNQLSSSYGLVDLAERPDGDDLRPGVESPGTWRQLTKDRELEVIVARDRLMKTHELVDRERAKQAAILNGHKIFKSTQRERTESADERKQGEKKKAADLAQAKMVLLRCMDELQKNVTNDRVIDLLRLLVDREIEFSKAHESYLKAHGLPVGGSVAKQIAKRPGPEIVRLLVEFIVSEGGFTWELSDEDSPYLKIFNVKPKSIAKQIARKAVQKADAST